MRICRESANEIDVQFHCIALHHSLHGETMQQIADAESASECRVELKTVMMTPWKFFRGA